MSGMVKLSCSAVALSAPSGIFWPGAWLMLSTSPLTTPLVLTQLSAYPLALPEGGSALRRVLDMASSLYNTTLSPAFTSNHPEAVYNYLLTGNAVTLCARLSAAEHLDSGRLVCRPVDDALLNGGQIQVQTHVSRPLPDAAQRFLRFIRSDPSPLF